MSRSRLLFLLVLLSLLCCLALWLPGWFKDPRLLVQGEWQEYGKMGRVQVTDSTAHWRSGHYKGTFLYTWVQTDSEPYTAEVSKGKDKWLIGISFEDDDHAVVDFYIVDKLPSEARDFIRARNKARNRPEDELKLRFRRIKAKNHP